MRQCTRRGLATIFLPSRCTFHLILSYGRPHSVCFVKVYRTSDPSDVCSIKIYRTSDPSDVRSIKIYRTSDPSDVCSVKIYRTSNPSDVRSVKIYRMSPLALYTLKSFSVCFSRKTYALILFISRQNFRRALETVLYLPIGGQIPIFGYCHCYIYRLFLYLS